MWIDSHIDVGEDFDRPPPPNLKTIETEKNKKQTHQQTHQQTHKQTPYQQQQQQSKAPAFFVYIGNVHCCSDSLWQALNGCIDADMIW